MFPRIRVVATTSYKILIIILCLTSIESDDQLYDDENNFDDIEQNNAPINYVEDPSPILLAILLLTFTAIVSFVGVVAGYISFKEDYLLKVYKKNGIAVDADVISFDSVRASLGSKDDKKAIELKVLVEYTVCLQGNYLARIQKQMNATASDFKLKKPCDVITPVQPPPSAPPPLLCKISSIESLSKEEKVMTTKFSYPSDLIVDSAVENEEYFLRTLSASQHDENNDNNQTRLYTLNILVIPGLPKSGYPTKQILRHGTCSYRSHTFIIIFILFSIASLCAFIALSTMIDEQVIPNNWSYIKWSIVGIILIPLLEFILIYCCLDRMFSYLIEEEYLYNGDFAASYCDETSLSSGSDMLLSDSKPVWVKEYTNF